MEEVRLSEKPDFSNHEGSKKIIAVANPRGRIDDGDRGCVPNDLSQLVQIEVECGARPAARCGMTRPHG
jgi:hypothetical protein